MHSTKGLQNGTRRAWRATLAIITAMIVCEIILIAAAHADIASVYPNAGPRACPGHPIGHTVAHRTLPCGTKLRFTRGRHTIIATVHDRGPFKPGRTWDFPQRSANALGFDDGLVHVKVSEP